MNNLRAAILGLSLVVMVSCHVPAPGRDDDARPPLSAEDINQSKSEFKGLRPHRRTSDDMPAIAWRDVTPPLGLPGSSPALRNMPVNPGDQLRIIVYRERDLSKLFVVAEDGTIDFPLLGRMEVEGLTPAQIAMRLREQLKGDYLVAPHVTADRVEFCAERVAAYDGDQP